MEDNLVRDIYERLGGIEAKLDDVRQIRNTANEANRKADLALNKSQENNKNIESLANTIKWGFGIVVTVVLPIAIAVLNLVVG